ncbi:MAG: hypothetical protein IGS03_01320 [Candidatus Sericytochromatia bacterium]|nr:hypothetical protein [Candidatus Sericytochromatia bacterium]
MKMAPHISGIFGGTGPLPPLPTPQQPRPTTSVQPTETSALPGESDHTQQYQQAEMDAVAGTLQFDPVGTRAAASLQMLKQLRSQPLSSLSPEQRAQANALAEGLDFPNPQSLAHATRHLSPEALNEWARSLPADLTRANLASANAALRTLAETETQNFFARYSASPPTFSTRDNREWSAQAYLSVLNSFTEMAQRLPPSEMQRLIGGNGDTPLRFERFGYQNPSGSDDLLDILSESMRIAYISDDRNTVYLGDATLNMDPSALVENTPALQNFIDQINRQPPSEAHVASLHNLLNASRPENRQLQSDQPLGTATWEALREFEIQQYLTQALDILQDDQSISSSLRQSLNRRVQGLQQTTFARGLPAGWQSQLQNGIFSERELSQLSPQSQARFARLRSRLADISQNQPQLNRGQLDLLVGNWFGILDEGNQRDFAEQAVTHEMGHRLHDMAINGARNPLLNDWAQISFQDFETPQSPSELMAATLRPDASNEFASAYGRGAANEDFAESFRLFTQNPAQLRESNPLKYMFLAGATGTYRGREKELIENLRAAGHSDAELRDAVRTLRGQQSDYAAQQAETWTDRAGQAARAIPLVSGVMNSLAALGLTDQAQDMFTGAIAERASHRDRHFDVSVASMLPGLERQLEMDPIRAVSPRQPHYVLDTLSLWASDALGPDVPATNRREAQGRLGRFAREGLAAFPRHVRNQIPEDIHRLLEQPAGRAQLMSMAYLHATPQMISNSSAAVDDALATDGGMGMLSAQAEHQAIRHLDTIMQRVNDRDAFMNSLRQFMGDELFDAIPQRVRVELEDPSRRQALSGYGLTHVSGRLQTEAMDSSLTSIQNTVSEIVGESARFISGLLERQQERPNQREALNTGIQREIGNILHSLREHQILPQDINTESLMRAIERALQTAPTTNDGRRSREELHGMVVDILADHIPHIAAQTG